jgi:hypothetical protein
MTDEYISKALLKLLEMGLIHIMVNKDGILEYVKVTPHILNKDSNV